MLLTKQNLELAKVLPKGNSAIDGLYVTTRETVVTDGHMLIRMETSGIPVEHFPHVEGFEAQDTFNPFILTKDAALEVAKNVPKYSQRLPVLSHAAVGQVNGRAPMAVTDLDNPKTFNPKPMEGRYPDFEMVCKPNKVGTETLSFQVDAALLVSVLQRLMTVADDRSHCVTFRIKDSVSPVRIDAGSDQKAMALVMPLKSKDLPKYPMLDGE